MANNGFRFSCSRFGCIWAVVLCISILPARGWCDSGDRPSAFLDSAARIDLSVTVAVDPASLAGHIAVVCGGSPDPVVRIEAAGSSGVESPPADPNQVELAGSFQSALGGEAWQTNDRHTRMCEHGPGVFELVVRIPAGSYEYKVTRGGTWAQNWGAGFSPGGGNIALNVPRTSLVRFVVDFNRRLILNSADDPNQVRPPTQTDSSHGASQAVSDTHPTRYLQLDLARPLGPTDIVRPMTVQMDGITIPVYARDVLSDAAYVYHGNDLGATYTHSQTTFKVWCPVSTSTTLLLYTKAVGGTLRSVPMHRGQSGVWNTTVPGNLNGVFYQYRFFSYGSVHTAPDLYGRAADVRLRRSMVIDLKQTNPDGWATVPAPQLSSPTDAVVYELHVRDFTTDPSSGVPASLRGKYLGLVDAGTHVPGASAPANAVTGLDYLRGLGVNYVHILPIQSINPEHKGNYNWGYETDLFNVPEPGYAVNPGDPAGVVRQVKTMVLGLHRAHMGLIMDVVYNHAVPVSGDSSPFWATVPYYYFRTGFAGQLLNESGVGNALDDDRPMVRKFICDSLIYWAGEYHIDGFRFDLIGMFTPETVRSISDALHRVRPDILLYGEPWTGGGPTRFGKGAQRNLKVAVFNDNFRIALRGDLDGTGAGFALGGGADLSALQNVISGSPDFASAPTESMNYVSIHDNLTLLDKIQKSLPSADMATQQRVLKFAGAIVLLSQGVPILEGGAEMGRTKGGDNNSHDAGDATNRFDWRRGLEFRPVESYYQGLIALRRAHPVFRCATAQLVRRTLSFYSTDGLPPKTVAFTLDGSATGDRWSRTLVVFHGETVASQITLPGGRWHVAVDPDHSGSQGVAVAEGTVGLAPLTAYVFYQDGGP